MRRICLRMIVCVLLLVCTQNCCAENSKWIEIAEKVQRWDDELREIENRIESPQQTKMLDVTMNLLATSEYVMLRQLENNASITEDLGEMMYQKGNIRSEEGQTYCQSEPVWIKEIGYYIRLWTQVREKYMNIRLTYYDSDGLYVASESITLARRNNVIRCLLTDYLVEEDSTGRYAFQIIDDDMDILFTRTMGEVFNIRMNLDRWESGEDVPWNKNWLYSDEQ